MDGETESILQRGHLTNHCQLIETNSGLILVDTGFGLNDVREPEERLSSFFLKLLKPEFREELTAIRQIEALGYDLKDVRHIILTHLDFDHAGGLDDFPWAHVHLMEEEQNSALLQKTWLDRQRYRPAQWRNRTKWNVYRPSTGESWYGLKRVQKLYGITDEVTLIPLYGHTFGHAGVAMKNNSKWLLNAGDAYFYHKEMSQKPCCTPGLTFYQNMMEKDHEQRVYNQKLLRNIKHFNGEEIEIFCSHDVVEFERLSGRSVEIDSEHFLKVGQDEHRSTY